MHYAAGRMTRFVGATEAARLLGVQKATLYAYVSRGLIARRVAVDGRTSLYAADDIDALAERVRRRETQPRPSLDVQIVTAVTTLDETRPALPRSRRRRARPHGDVRAGRRAAVDRHPAGRGDVAGAAAGRRPPGAAGRPRRRRARWRCRRWPPCPAPSACTTRATTRRPRPAVCSASCRRSSAPATAGAPVPGSASASPPSGAPTPWRPSGRRSTGRSILLADHELATSTLAVRVAASTWTGPYPAFAAGLATVQGRAPRGDVARGLRALRRVRAGRRGRRRHATAAGRDSACPGSAT